MPVEGIAGWFQNMRGRCTPGGNAPAIITQQQGGLGSRAGKAELAVVADAARGRGIVPQRAQPLTDIGVTQPNDIFFAHCLYRIESLRRHELDGPGAVLADMGEQPERVSGGDVEAAGPARQNLLVVRQQAPHEGIDGGVRMFTARQWHGQRDGITMLSPCVGVDEA
jgi:hypothetical protein